MQMAHVFLWSINACPVMYTAPIETVSGASISLTSARQNYECAFLYTGIK